MAPSLEFLLSQLFSIHVWIFPFLLFLLRRTCNSTTCKLNTKRKIHILVLNTINDNPIFKYIYISYISSKHHLWKYTSFILKNGNSRKKYIYIYIKYPRENPVSLVGLINPSASHRQRSSSHRIPMEATFPLESEIVDLETSSLSQRTRFTNV